METIVLSLFLPKQYKDYSLFFDQFVKDVQTRDSYFQSTHI